ncbi:DUF5082 domain-containing protein [Bacillus sp. T33-2]|uniref:DUF5082 domain-containing protein n=1 Tax=Bacillus sp. T33-2 TaxID=2054168 RepID=UPI000C77738E|nr:DUF5082 domain-containing protein [Bacillus sp. T33-2]PLR91995.1 DUF5082 domain-containing protein [Bacillus sp. T33-2]
MSLSYLYAKLSKKQEDLRHLIRCEGELSQHQQDFVHHRHLCTAPELSSDTWEGDLARSFDMIRDEYILTEYQDITGNQFNKVFRILSNKVEDIVQDIEHIKQMIASLEAEERRRAREDK